MFMSQLVLPPSSEPHTTGERPAPLWHVWRAVDGLDRSLLVRDAEPRKRFGALVEEVQHVLTAWGLAHAGEAAMQSFLNGKGLLHEAEECVVGLHHVLAYLGADCARGERPVVVDLCAGKGTFSVLLAALVARRPALSCEIVLVEKSMNINWRHVPSLLGPDHTVQMWTGCNIHDAAFVEKLRQLPGPLAIIAIHLCKNLSPRCVSLYNALGRAKAPFLALAPCCLRLSAAQVVVLRFEAEDARRERMKSRCFICGGPSHRASDCPAVKAAGTSLCWRCGEKCHRRAACTAAQAAPRIAKAPAPSTTICILTVSASSSPFDAWSRALLEVCETEDGDAARLEVVPLASLKEIDPRNWNGSRKCTWVLAERVPAEDLVGALRAYLDCASTKKVAMARRNPFTHPRGGDADCAL